MGSRGTFERKWQAFLKLPVFYVLLPAQAWEYPIVGDLGWGFPYLEILMGWFVRVLVGAPFSEQRGDRTSGLNLKREFLCGSWYW